MFCQTILLGMQSNNLPAASLHWHITPSLLMVSTAMSSNAWSLEKYAEQSV
jgi:hypothetical protein